MRSALSAIVLGLLAAACDTTVESVHRPEPVVEAYLVAGRPLPQIRLTWTADIDGTYSAATGGIPGATVRVSEIDAQGGVARLADYAYGGGTAGVYEPVDAPTVRAGGRYRMEADLPGGERVEAETVVPASFDLVDRSADRVTYRSTDQFEIEVTPSSYPGREPIYVISLEALDPSPARLTPLYLDALYDIGPDEAYDPDTLDVSEYRDLVVVSSPPLNEANYREPGEPTVRARLPWFSVVFYGRARIRINAIDDNLYDFIRYQAVQRGGSTLSPGEIPNIREGIEGGTGVFGSYASVEAVVEILEPPGG